MANVTARDLLTEAREIFDEKYRCLNHSARRAWGGGFVTGGEWMREALALMRNETVRFYPIDFATVGFIKYGASIAATLIVVTWALWVRQLALLPFAFVLFYLVEVQMLFVFPLAIDQRKDLVTSSRQLVRRAGGTWRAMIVVVPIAANMIFGGFCGRGFIRSWCLGCLAVLIWYERLRQGMEEAPCSQRAVFEIGNSQRLLVRHETIRVGKLSRSFRIAYVSDLHLRGGSAATVTEVVSALRNETLDAVLLGGDLVDTASGLGNLRRLIKTLGEQAPVWAIAGNHDEWVGTDVVKHAVQSAGGNWLGNDTTTFGSGADQIQIDGAIRQNGHALRILCLHDPSAFPSAVQKNYALVLAGHLHGGQVVVSERNGLFYPGAFVYRWNGLRFEMGSTVMLVSRGVSDTVRIRWNCPREILICEIS